MVGQITALVADAGLNIADLLNKSRGELAYTLVDVNGEVPPALLANIKRVNGVLNARVL
jgi:D-3-phosphoglycerate dehydrogenase